MLSREEVGPLVVDRISKVSSDMLDVELLSFLEFEFLRVMLTRLTDFS